MTLEILGPLGAFLTVVTLMIGFFFAGGRRWRGNYDAEHTKAERLQATLVEKDAILEGQGERLKRLDEVVQELGGERVVLMLSENHAENLRLFKEIADSLAQLRKETKDGYDHLARVNQEGFDKLARAFHNGGGGK